jgi:hypothetical protein
MVKLLLGVSSQQRNSRQSGRVGIACVLGALVAGCATGVSIDDNVSLIPPSALIEREPTTPEGGGDGLEPSPNDIAVDEEPTPASGEMSEGAPDENLARGDQQAGNEPNPSPPEDEEPEDDDSAPVPPDDEPIPDTDPDVDDPDPTPGPTTPPDPAPGLPPVVNPPVSNPPNPPGGTDPDPLPPLDPDDIPTPVLPGHCLAGWEGSSCDVCSGQTQSDRLACRVHIDCYILNDCDPVSCGNLDAACGVNSLNNGLAPKEIADEVYGCMCAP